jgi:hypothetical protein
MQDFGAQGWGWIYEQMLHRVEKLNKSNASFYYYYVALRQACFVMNHFSKMQHSLLR